VRAADVMRELGIRLLEESRESLFAWSYGVELRSPPDRGSRGSLRPVTANVIRTDLAINSKCRETVSSRGN